MEELSVSAEQKRFTNHPGQTTSCYQTIPEGAIRKVKGLLNIDSSGDVSP